MAVTDITTHRDRSAADEQDSTRLRVAVVGTGFMGQVHARAARTAGARVVAAVGSPRRDAAGAAAAVGAEQGWTDLAALLAETPVDVVHVCTPNALHAEQALAAVEAGCHVVCEKPLATSAAQAGGMADAAATAGRVAAVPFVYRYHSMVRELRARLAAGDAGRVSAVTGSYLQDWLSSPADSNWRLDSAAGGTSRAFGDIGSHWCDLAEFVTGDPIARLSARTRAVLDRGGAADTEDVAAVQFETTAGVVGVMLVSQVSAGRKNRLQLEVSGTETSYAFDQEQPELLWVGRRDGGQVLLRDPETLSPDARRLSRLPAGHAQGYQDCFDAFVADVYAAVAGGRPEGLPSFEAGARSAALVDAVLTSAAELGAWVEVAE